MSAGHEDATGSISVWLGRLKAGEDAAATRVVERFFHRAAALARGRMRARGAVVSDEEDVAVSALDSLCRGARAGRFPKLDDRDDLWRVLACITTRKVADVIEREGRLKRGGDAQVHALEDVAEAEAADPSPEMAALVELECRRLLEALESDELVQIALWKVEGWTNDEIAARLHVAPRTVERKLQLIRDVWDAA